MPSKIPKVAQVALDILRLESEAHNRASRFDLRLRAGNKVVPSFPVSSKSSAPAQTSATASRPPTAPPGADKRPPQASPAPIAACTSPRLDSAATGARSGGGCPPAPAPTEPAKHRPESTVAGPVGSSSGSSSTNDVALTWREQLQLLSRGTATVAAAAQDTCALASGSIDGDDVEIIVDGGGGGDDHGYLAGQYGGSSIAFNSCSVGAALSNTSTNSTSSTRSTRSTNSAPSLSSSFTASPRYASASSSPPPTAASAAAAAASRPYTPQRIPKPSSAKHTSQPARNRPEHLSPSTPSSAAATPACPASSAAACSATAVVTATATSIFYPELGIPPLPPPLRPRSVRATAAAAACVNSSSSFAAAIPSCARPSTAAAATSSTSYDSTPGTGPPPPSPRWASGRAPLAAACSSVTASVTAFSSSSSSSDGTPPPPPPAPRPAAGPAAAAAAAATSCRPSTATAASLPPLPQLPFLPPLPQLPPRPRLPSLPLPPRSHKEEQASKGAAKGDTSALGRSSLPLFSEAAGPLPLEFEALMEAHMDDLLAFDLIHWDPEQLLEAALERVFGGGGSGRGGGGRGKPAPMPAPSGPSAAIKPPAGTSVVAAAAAAAVAAAVAQRGMVGPVPVPGQRLFIRSRSDAVATRRSGGGGINGGRGRRLARLLWVLLSGCLSRQPLR